MAYQVDDALADIVFTFGEYNDDFFYYSNSLGIQSTLLVFPRLAWILFLVQLLMLVSTGGQQHETEEFSL